MRKVAVFGKPGSGKSTLSKTLAKVTGLPLHQLDSLFYQKSGEPVARKTFDKAHEDILASDSWIIDGLGPLGAFKQRLDAADTLVYIDLPYPTSYWFVTKRLLKGLFIKPEGWPEGSSVLRGSMLSYKMLRLSPSFWNDEFMAEVEDMDKDKSVFVIRSLSELKAFIEVHAR
ncbi:adenylate kinase [Neptuniibacter sp. QD34_54]|uniref:adenylate kinase n=1 Tax=Neptuniibacter sp. QD34_54 TaxID=3398208 RepID=UPI0039F50111